MNRLVSLPDATIAQLLMKMRFSRRPSTNLGAEPGISDEGLKGIVGFVYLDNLYIEGPYYPEGEPSRLYLTLFDNGYSELTTEKGLADLEEKLFEFALTEGFFDEELSQLQVKS